MTDQKAKKLPNPSPAPNHVATRPPGTCGCSPSAHSALPPGEDRTSNLVGPVRGRNRARRATQADPGGEAHRRKMNNVHAERAPEAFMDPTDP